jgi:phosphate acetyltransferase
MINATLNSTAAQRLVTKALGNRPSRPKPRILLSEGTDSRMQEAAKLIAEVGFADVTLLIPRGIKVDSHPCVQQIQQELHPQLADFTSRLFLRRKHKGLIIEAAGALMESPLFLAASLLAANKFDAVVSGAINTTADVLRAGIYCLDKAANINVVSSFFLMCLPDGRIATYADCGVVPNPSAIELAEIALSSANAHRQITGQEPRVAFLSFSTKGSAEHESLGKIRAAFEHFKKIAPHIVADGELQFDSAFIPQVAARKAPTSPVAGNANIFIFPDLNSGNIAYKITERLGNALALGPIVQGFSKPWMDLSRGCSAADIVLVAAVAAILAASDGTP